MPIVRYKGRVVFPGMNISIGYNPQITHSEPAINFSCTFTVNVTNSVVEVVCDLPHYDHADDVLRNRLYIRAYDKARAALNLVSFALGRPQLLLLETFVLPDGTQGPVVFDDPGLAALCTMYQINAPAGDGRFDDIYKLVLGDNELFLALDDLIMAITMPHVAAINCGRVLDGIRRMIAPGVPTKNGWAAMQTALNIDPQYQRFISNTSADPRHADRSFIPGETATDIVTRTWTIMNRFIAYKKGGGTQLTPPEYPLLS
jgi:hypothetical protein